MSLDCLSQARIWHPLIVVNGANSVYIFLKVLKDENVRNGKEDACAYFYCSFLNIMYLRIVLFEKHSILKNDEDGTYYSTLFSFYNSNSNSLHCVDVVLLYHKFELFWCFWMFTRVSSHTGIYRLNIESVEIVTGRGLGLGLVPIYEYSYIYTLVTLDTIPWYYTTVYTVY